MTMIRPPCWRASRRAARPMAGRRGCRRAGARGAIHLVRRVARAPPGCSPPPVRDRAHWCPAQAPRASTSAPRQRCPSRTSLRPRARAELERHRELPRSLRARPARRRRARGSSSRSSPPRGHRGSLELALNLGEVERQRRDAHVPALLGGLVGHGRVWVSGSMVVTVPPQKPMPRLPCAPMGLASDEVAQRRVKRLQDALFVAASGTRASRWLCRPRPAGRSRRRRAPPREEAPVDGALREAVERDVLQLPVLLGFTYTSSM